MLINRACMGVGTSIKAFQLTRFNSVLLTLADREVFNGFPALNKLLISKVRKKERVPLNTETLDVCYILYMAI